MIRSEIDLPMLFLKPGEMFVGEEPTLVSTLLGSCVSVVMFNRRHSLGAICHSLLPANIDQAHACTDRCTDGFRYVECAVRRMVNIFLARHISRKDIEVKVFGGSDMFSFVPATVRNATVGAQNIEAAMRILEEQQLRVLASDVGGKRGRKILFYTHSGEVLLKRLNEKDVTALQ